MTKIIDNLDLINSWDRKPEWRSPLTSCVVYRDDTTLQNDGFGVKYKYTLLAKIGIDFWCNQAQLQHSIETSKKILADRLYGDANSLLRELTQAVHSQDEETALEIIDEMRKVLS